VTPRNVLTGLAVVVLIVAVVVGGYLGGWWLKKDTTDRRVGIQNRNTGVQTAWRHEAHDKVDDYLLVDPDTPAAASLRRSACDLIGRLTDNYLDDQLAEFQATEC
jgi:hypothetical protein